MATFFLASQPISATFLLRHVYGIESSEGSDPALERSTTGDHPSDSRWQHECRVLRAKAWRRFLRFRSAKSRSRTLWTVRRCRRVTAEPRHRRGAATEIPV